MKEWTLVSIFALLCAGASAWAVRAGGWELAGAGWLKGGKLLLQITPILVLAFGLSGLLQTLVPTEKIQSWLGSSSGWRGIFLGACAGAVTPGGPFTSFPIVAGLWHAGAGIGTLVAYLTAWSTWAVMRLPIEAALISPRFVFIRLACTFTFPFLAGGLAHYFFRRWF